MTRIKVLGPMGVALLTAVAVLVMGACGNSEPDPSPTRLASTAAPPPAATTAPPQPTATPAPTGAPTATAVPAATATLVPPTATPVPPTAAPTATPAPTATAGPTSTPAPTPPPRYPTAPTATPVPEPTSTSTVEPTPIAVQFTNVEEFGFTWRLDGDVDVNSTGWTETEPSNAQGQLNFVSGGVSSILIWSPSGDRAALDYLVETYNILRGSQPDITYSAVSEDELTVSGQDGIYGGFTASGASGAVVGGGIIGSWVCSGPETAYRLTVNGVDAAVVQIRFDRLVDNFGCSS